MILTIGSMGKHRIAVVSALDDVMRGVRTIKRANRGIANSVYGNPISNFSLVLKTKKTSYYSVWR